MIPGTSHFKKRKSCKICGSTSTSQWRRGPDGKPSLCNACGLRFQWKLSHEKRIPPNNDPQPISIASLLNPVDLEESHNSHQNTSERNVSKKMKR